MELIEGKVQECAQIIDLLMNKCINQHAAEKVALVNQLAAKDEEIKQLTAKITELENKDKQDGDDPGHT